MPPGTLAAIATIRPGSPGGTLSNASHEVRTSRAIREEAPFEATRMGPPQSLTTRVTSASWSRSRSSDTIPAMPLMDRSASGRIGWR
jgi:hypothetical protein